MPFNHYLSRKGCSASRKAALCVPAGLKTRHLPIQHQPDGSQWTTSNPNIKPRNLNHNYNQWMAATRT